MYRTKAFKRGNIKCFRISLTPFFRKKGEMLMVTTENDMMDFIEEYDVKFIRLAFLIYLEGKKIFPLCLMNCLGH